MENKPKQESSDFMKLLQTEGFTFQINSNQIKNDDMNEENLPDLFKHAKPELIKGFSNEEDYQEGTPFEMIAKKMFDLVPDGKIKKRIIREGQGEETPEDFSLVKIEYNAYVEGDDDPFDSTYVRKQPFKFIVNDGRCLAGLDFGVKSMKLNEKAQFLIHQNYAYGNNYIVGRGPRNEPVLFEVELLEISKTGAIFEYERLPQEKQELFSEVYKYCLALNERAKGFFVSRRYKKAIVDYNTAIVKLNHVIALEGGEFEKKRDLNLKVHSNLLVSYLKNSEPKKGVETAKKIYDMTQNGDLAPISAKVYFNHAKCCRLLNEFDNALLYLKKASKIEPKNTEIGEEMLILEQLVEKYKKTEEVLAKALLGTSIK